ncbi:MAG: hypothetical protein IPL26_21510 [Leptospiraceae bacterium]|nr:hypothetical protein [Leptospiraceae bacterium]
MLSWDIYKLRQFMGFTKDFCFKWADNASPATPRNENDLDRALAVINGQLSTDHDHKNANLETV